MERRDEVLSANFADAMLPSYDTSGSSPVGADRARYVVPARLEIIAAPHCGASHDGNVYLFEDRS